MSFRCFHLIPGTWLVLTCAASFPLHASANEIGGNVALTSDYVFRGISQTQERPAWQGGLRADASNGLYGSVWVSRVDFETATAATAEIDYVVGWHRRLGDNWTGDVNATWFSYASAGELNYLEWIATVAWRDRTWLMTGASRDVFATGRTGIYAQAGQRIALSDATRLEFAGGYYWLDHAYGHSYAHAQGMVAWLVHPRIELRVLGHLTDHNARTNFGDLAGPRIEAALQASF
ncbi:MAG TPA: TorF family putative porin [Lysobacter sp.]|nr:TorF family putative porin [Lysobacter sp.]